MEDFDIEFFKDRLGSLEYPLNFSLMKTYFEKHFIYILKDNSFYQVRKEFRYDRNRNKQVSIKLEEYNERGLSNIMIETPKGKETFIGLLKRDGFKMYKNIIFDPTRMENRNYYNIFKGFGYKDIRDEPTLQQRLNFKKWLNYIKRYVCEGNMNQFNYFMNFLSNIILEPDFKPHICYIFYSSKKGTGKSWLCKMLRKLVGMKHSFIGNVRVIFDKHSTSSEYKFINILEELDKKMGNETYEQLKDKIQQEDCNINKKFKDIIEIKDYTRYIITTNDYRSLCLDRDNRRFVLLNFEITEDKETLELLNEVYEVNSNIYVRLFGEYLSEWDIEYNTRTEWIKNRSSSDKIKLFLKTTPIQELLVNFYRGDLEEIMGTLLTNDSNIYSVGCRSLYLTYTETIENKKYVVGKGNFKKEMKTYDFVRSIRSNGEYYRINMLGLYKYLIEEGLIENEEFENKHIEN